MALFRILRRRADWMLAIALAMLFQLEVWVPDASQASDLPRDVGLAEQTLTAAAGLIFSLALGWRRQIPVVVLALAFAAMALLRTNPIEAPATFTVGLLVAAYSVGAHARGVPALIGGLQVALLVLLVVVQEPEQVQGPGDLVFILLVLGGPWLAGLAIRYRREREHVLEGRTVDLERNREERAREAVAEERSRIARELHDVVAHAISVMVLQARGGRRSLTTDPDEALAAFNTIETMGSRALAEMRRLLGMLRRDDEQIALAPQPTLRNLDALIAQVSEAGLPVDVSVEGKPKELPPGIDLSAYRIVQEGLTNALKHAGPATARVVIRYGMYDVEVEIIDTGAGMDASDGEGQGLVGMRERVSLFGGRIETGPQEGGGFAVRARLPLDSARS